MSEIARLWVSIKADTKEFEQSMKGVQGKLNTIGKGFMDVGKKMSMYITLPLIAAVGGMANSAMELEATAAKYNTVFEGMTDDADAFIKKFQELTPATTASARSMASGIQDLLVPMGFMREEATDMTGEFMHVIGALTNFNSATHTAQDVTIAMQAAVTGEYESLKRLGIQLDVNTVKEKAVAMGLAATTGEVTKQHQAQVLLAEVYAQSSDALNAYTEENLDAKTKMGLMKAELMDTAAQIGTHLLPAITKIVDVIRQWTEKFAALTPEQQKVILVVIGIVAALGPLLMIIGKVIMIISALMPILAALKVAFLIMLGPVGLVIAIIAALIAIGILVWKNWDTIKAKAAEIWGSIKEFFIGLWEWMKGFFAEWGPVILAVLVPFIGLPLLLAKHWDALREMMLKIWEAIKIGVINKATLLYDSVISIVNKALDWIKALPAQALQWGKDIIQGLINGIRNMASNLAGVLKGVVDNAVSGVKKFLGLSSPSKLFEGFGVNIGRGLEQGIDKVKASVNVSMESLVSPSGVAMAGAGGGGGYNIIVELDGRQIAKATGPHLMNEIRVKQGLKI